MTPIDGWALAVPVLLLALAASVRLSVPGLASLAMLRAIAHPNWLLPLLLIVPMTVGLMVTGTVPAAPWQARAMAAAGHGYWAGIAALIAVATVELWLLWTPGMIAYRTAKPESRPAARILPVLNLVLGGLILLLIVWAK